MTDAAENNRPTDNMSSDIEYNIIIYMSQS